MILNYKAFIPGQVKRKEETYDINEPFKSPIIHGQTNRILYPIGY